MNKKPLMIDLYCGLGGWSEGFLAEGWDCIGFDIERHDYGAGGYPGQLVLQDCLTLIGSQFKDADCIVASPPCQEYSYMAMPWSRAKTIAAEYRAGVRDVKKLTALFDACFRIQREAIEAAGHFIPLVVENVRGAQPWVGRSRANFGSYHLWGDVPALMPMTKHLRMKAAVTHRPDDAPFLDFRKVPGFRFDGSGRSFQGASVNGLKAAQDGLGGYGGNFGWDNTPLRRGNSKSAGRKMASAMIAKIPLTLARHIARVWFPRYPTLSEPEIVAPA